MDSHLTLSYAHLTDVLYVQYFSTTVLTFNSIFLYI